ncbi:hypothetical protein D4764_08G0002040 [Takifugu flavidus]|uniref:CCHC-type domain-containing protein n=1 Tax=Takifugu flavidus TaxID=433684 RepID=A0A5C6MS54_9TELE|nr:hypothetical protein D4764_08G0002040 [Takifugu flavidus]
MAANANLTVLSRRHGVKVGAGSMLSVEEVALAVGQEIGHSSVKCAARMNRAVVLFLETAEQANKLVETGITVGEKFVQVTSLTQPAARITLSNVPPFISDEFLAKELVASSALKCFNCDEEGHLARACPSRLVLDAPEAETAAPEPDPAAPPALRPVPAGRRRWCGAEGSPAVPEVAKMESKAEGKGSECVRVAEVSGERENVEMVVEVTGESGEGGSKNFLTQTKGMRGPDLGIYFPNKLLFIQSARHWIKHRAASDITDPEIFHLKKHMGKTRKQLR